MRVFLTILVSLGLAFGMYLIFLHMTEKAGGGPPQVIISGTTVQMQLVNLAQAERMYFVQNSAYATIDQLASSGDFKLPNPDPNGYSYSVDVSPSGFTATAEHGANGSPDNYPVFTIDQSMAVHRSDSQGGADKPVTAAAPGDTAKPSGSAKDAKQDDDVVPTFNPGSLPSLPAGLTPSDSALTPAPKN